MDKKQSWILQLIWHPIIWERIDSKKMHAKVKYIAKTNYEKIPYNQTFKDDCK